MKGNLAAAVLLAATAVSLPARAQLQDPQPSFRDSAPVQSAPMTRGRMASADGFPQPSFVDFVALERQVITTGATADVGFPERSFAADGGPTGPRSVLGVDPERTAMRESLIPAPSFGG